MKVLIANRAASAIYDCCSSSLNIFLSPDEYENKAECIPIFEDTPNLARKCGFSKDKINIYYELIKNITIKGKIVFNKLFFIYIAY